MTERDLSEEFTGYFVGADADRSDESFEAGYAHLQEQIDCALPAEYHDFVRRYGLYGFERKMIFPIPDEKKDVVQVFLGFTRKNFAAYDINRVVGTIGQRLPPGVLPFAVDPYGNYLCYKIKGGAIYFWDHEIMGDTPRQKDMTRLSDSLAQWLKTLEVGADEDDDE